jgi:hypothetical protein
MMYFIALRLQGPETEYEQLFNLIKALGPWSNRLSPTWVVESRYSASAIRDLLKKAIKPGDRVFVGQFVKNWAGTNMGPDFPEWMNRRSFDAPVPLKPKLQ